MYLSSACTELRQGRTEIDEAKIQLVQLINYCEFHVQLLALNLRLFMLATTKLKTLY